MKWISVNWEVPKDKRVLVTVKDGLGNRIVKIASFLPGKLNVYQWYFEDSNPFLGAVMSWQPLPEPKGVKMKKIVDFEELMEHTMSEVICVKCYDRHYCVRPTITPLKDLECKNCGAGFIIETGQIIEETEE